MWSYNYTFELCHYGVKGMKWGVRRARKQLGYAPRAIKESSVRKTVSGHSATPKKDEPHAIIDHVSSNGKIDVRSFYDDFGWKIKDIHTHDHGHSKAHPSGAHITEYTWNENGNLNSKSSRELTEQERKENKDIL